MSRRRKHRGSGEEVTLNMAAMLDMAFQLLTFFILTFKPSPVEGQISMSLPPPQAIITNQKNAQKAGNDDNNKNPVAGVSTLIINVYSGPNGRLEGCQVGEENVGGLGALRMKLETMFRDPANPFEQVILQIEANLQYEDLMKVVEICSSQTMPDGKPLTKLSFIELPSAGK